jgi:hypothetical protein
MSGQTEMEERLIKMPINHSSVPLINFFPKIWLFTNCFPRQNIPHILTKNNILKVSHTEIICKEDKPNIQPILKWLFVCLKGSNMTFPKFTGHKLGVLMTT